MARTIPALPQGLPDPSAMPPRSVIDSTDVVNLAGATNIEYFAIGSHIGSQFWADGQATYADAGVGVWTVVGSIRFPPISNKHIRMYVRVYCISPGANAQYRVRNLAGSTYSSAVIPNALGWVSITTPVLNAAATYEVLQIEVTRGATIHGWSAHHFSSTSPNAFGANIASWPALALTIGPAVDGDFIGLDTDEFLDDRPLTSDLMAKVLLDQEYLAARPLMLFAAMEPDPGLWGPVRWSMPVDLYGSRVRVWMQAENFSATDSDVYWQEGGGGKSALPDAQNQGATGLCVVAFTIPAGAAMAWYSADTLYVRDILDGTQGAPRTLTGFTTAGLGFDLTKLTVTSISVWRL